MWCLRSTVPFRSMRPSPQLQFTLRAKEWWLRLAGWELTEGSSHRAPPRSPPAAFLARSPPTSSRLPSQPTPSMKLTNCKTNQATKLLRLLQTPKESMIHRWNMLMWLPPHRIRNSKSRIWLTRSGRTMTSTRAVSLTRLRPETSSMKCLQLRDKDHQLSKSSTDSFQNMMSTRMA
jgi:hypothetical protein